MFDSLDETMKKDEQSSTTSRERMTRWAIIAIASVAVFAGVLFAVQFLGVD